jgi:antitoxin HigA-1
MVKSERLPPIHPGEILREDFMKPLGLSMNRLALDLRVPVTRIAEIVHERRGITPDTALRLGRYFNTSARFWKNAQSSYDLEVAQDELQRTIERDVRWWRRPLFVWSNGFSTRPKGFRSWTR